MLGTVSKQECAELGGAVKNGVCVVEKEYRGGETAPLKAGGFADKGIVPIIDLLNAKGCPTVASCSGLRVDHYGHEEGAYLSVEMPEHVVRPNAWGSIFDVEPEDVLKPDVVHCFINAGGRANWRSELSKYLTFIPTVHYSLPKTKFVQTDKDAEAEPNVVAAEKELERVMNGLHTNSEFFTALDKRDVLKEKAYKRHGQEAGYWTDERVHKAWERLQTEVLTCCNLLKK